MKRSRVIAGVVFAVLFALLLSAGAQTVNEFQPAISLQGRAVAVTVNPANNDYAIVASESGGLFKTEDRGWTWSHIDTLPMFRMRDVKYGPPVPGALRLVIASGWGDSRVGNRGGIWRSTDGGVNWIKPATSNPSCSTVAGTWGIAFLPDTDNVYVGTDCGLAISRDLGATWTYISPNPSKDPRIYGVAAHNNTGGFLSGTVDICGAAGHLRSTDRGATFGLPTGSPAGEGPHCIAASPVESSVLFVASRAGTSASTVYEGDYDSGGAITWKPVSPPGPSARASWVATNRSRDGNPDHFDIYFGTGRDVLRQTVTRKGGTGPRCSNTAWTPVVVDHDDQNGMAFSTANNCAQFIVSDGGVHRTLNTLPPPYDCGAIWSIANPRNNGLNALQIYQVIGQMSYVPKHTDIYIGTQDNGFWGSSDGGSTWPFQGSGAEGFHIQLLRYAISHQENLNLEDTVTWTDPFNAPNNHTGLAHFAAASAWKNPSGPLIDNPTVIDQSDWGVRVQYRELLPWKRVLAITTDDGASWENVVSNPLNFPQTMGGWPQVSVAYPDVTLYQAYKRAGTLSSGEERIGLFKITGIRTDGSIFAPKVSLADVSGLGSIGGFCLGEGTFLCPAVFAVDPNDPSHLMAADVEAGQMKVSIDAGATWTPDTQLTDLVRGYNPATGTYEFYFNLPWNSAPLGANLQPHAIAFDPFHKGHILVGTEAAGIIRSTDGGANWALVPDSRKVTAISSFFFIDEFRNGNLFPEVLVSSYGRGLWKMTFPPSSRSLAFRLPPEVIDDWRACWLRSPLGGCIMPEDLLDFAHCPSCLHHAVVDGSITDISLSPEGVVQSIAIDSGRVIASTQDGQPVASSVRIRTSGNLGNFDGCPECISLVQQGGEIRGVVLEEGRIKAIIGGSGPLPGEDWLRRYSPPPPQPVPTPELAPPAEPYLQLAGTVPLGGQATAFTGDKVGAAGSGFCGDPGCSPVVLSIGDRVVAANVPVDPNGNFQTTFTLTEPPGAYTVRAMQQTSGGQLLTGATRLVVPVSEVEEEESERPGISIGINFAADEPPGVGSALAPLEKAGVVPQANWNNMTGASGSASSLVMDFSGTPEPSSVSVRWSSPNTWSTTGRGEANNGFPPGPDRTLMSGYLDTTDLASGAATVTVSDLGPEFATRGYDVIVYALGAVGGRGGAYTIGSTAKIGTAPTNPTNFVEDPGVDMTDLGNYMRFNNLHSASFTLVADASRGNIRAPINGIQILARPGFDFNDCMKPPGTMLFHGTDTGPTQDPDPRRGYVGHDGSASNCVVHLTDASVGASYGVFVIPDPVGGNNIHMHWRSLVGGDNGSVCTATQFGRPGGDGYSMSWGTDLPNPPSYGNPGEEGSGSGLIVTVDTFDNGGGEAPGLEIKWRGARVAFDNINADQGLAKDFLRKGVFVEADLTVDTAGHATFTYDGRVLTATLADWTGIVGGGCMFAARTGGACDNHWIDDLVIEKFRPDRPVITVQPQSQTVVAGNNATFAVVASGTEPLSYQWRMNGTNLAGATSASYALLNTQPGVYTFVVVVSNAAGSVTSAVATLTVSLGGELVLNPTNGPVGRAVSVSVVGLPSFLAGEKRVVTLDGNLVATQTLVTCARQEDGAGFGLLCDGVPVSLIVPAVADGPHALAASTGVGNPGLAATFVVGSDFSAETQAGVTGPGRYTIGPPFPPQPMEGDEERNSDELPPLPEGRYVPRRQSQPMSVAGAGNFVPAAFTRAGPTEPVKLVRNTVLTAAGDPPDPSAASSGRVVVYTANTYLGISTDCGITFQVIDPTTVFPADADGGLCCDQVVHYAPQIDRFIWLMQFWDNPRASCGANRYRLAVASPADIISNARTAWTYWDLTSANLGLTGGYRFMDYPDLAVGANALYLTANLPCSNGKLIVRFILADFVAPGAPGLPFRFLARDDVVYRMAQNCDTRAFWAGLLSSSTIRLFSWDESSPIVSWNDYTIPTSPIFAGADYASLTPDGRNWLQFGGPPRNMVATGVKVGNELWFAWNAGRDSASVPAAGRIPHPRIEVVKFNATTFAFNEHLPIWNPDHAFAYPALGANSDGEVGFSFAWGGGGDTLLLYYANHGVGILTGLRFLQNTYTSSHGGWPGAATRWGDYLAVRRHYPETRLFSASGFGIRRDPAAPGGFTYDPRYILFGRASVPAPICLKAGGISGGRFYFEVIGERGSSFKLQGSTDLTDWTDLLQSIFQNETYSFTDEESSGLPYRFYRALVPGQ